MDTTSLVADLQDVVLQGLEPPGQLALHLLKVYRSQAWWSRGRAVECDVAWVDCWVSLCARRLGRSRGWPDGSPPPRRCHDGLRGEPDALHLENALR